MWVSHFLKMMLLQNIMKLLSVSVLHFRLSYLHSLKLVSHTHVRIDILLLCLIQNLALNQKNSLNYICYLVSPFLLPIVVLSWSCCLVSELVALVRAFTVDFHLVYPAPCRRDYQVPIHILLLWDRLIVSLLLVPPSGRKCQCHLSYFLWLDSPLGVANFCLQTGCLTFCQHLAMGVCSYCGWNFITRF